MPHSETDTKKKRRQLLVDVEVSHVALVDRPANRTPFKAIKRDETQNNEGAFPMHISVKNMFGSRPAEVTSVIADTQDKAVAVAKALMDGDKAELSEQDGVFVVRKTGTKPEGEQVVHLGKSTGVAYTMANLKKELSLYDGTSTDFDETMKSEGFIPGLHVGMEALHQTIFNIAMSDEASSPQAFAAAVSKAVDGFNAYLTDLISEMPDKVFKFEKALVAIAPNDLSANSKAPDGFSSEVYDAIFGETEGDGGTATESAEGEDGEAKEATEAATEGDEANAKAEAAEADDAAQATAEGEGEAKEAEAAPSNLEELPKGTAETTPMTQEELMAGIMEGLTKQVGTIIGEAMKPVTDRLDKAEANMGKLSKAVGGAVASTPEEDDNVITLTKSGGDPEYGPEGPPLMDTAYRSKKQG